MTETESRIIQRAGREVAFHLLTAVISRPKSVSPEAWGDVLVIWLKEAIETINAPKPE